MGYTSLLDTILRQIPQYRGQGFDDLLDLAETWAKAEQARRAAKAARRLEPPILGGVGAAGITPGGFTVQWTTDRPAKGWAIARRADSPVAVVEGPGPEIGVTHWWTFTGLQPETDYVVNVFAAQPFDGAQEAQSPPLMVRTADAPVEPGPEPPGDDGTPATPGQAPAAWNGAQLVAVWDMAAVPDWLRGLGFDSSDNGLYYAFSRSYHDGFRDRWQPDGLRELWERRGELAEAGRRHVDAVAALARNTPGVVAVVNDALDRCGDQVAYQTVNQLDGAIPTGEFFGS